MIIIAYDGHVSYNEPMKKFKSILHKDLVDITIANTLRSFGGALVEVFVPLLLLKHGLSLLGVSLFYVVYAVVKLVINYPSMRFTNRFGARPSLIIGRAAYIVYLLCLAAIVQTGRSELAWVMAVAMAFTNAFQWNAEHAFVSRAINMERKGKDIARIESITMMACSIAPAVAAGIAMVLGTSWPLYVAVACIVGSIFWLRKLDNTAGGHKQQQNIGYSLRHAPKRDLLANFAFNIHTAIGNLVFPIYMALVLSNIQSIGTVATIGSVGAAVFLMFIGNRNDSVGTAKVLREGSLATFGAHLLRLVPASTASVAVINIVWLLALRYQQNPWTSTYYAHTRKQGMSYILSMEIACDIAYVALFIAVFAILALCGYQLGFAIIFILAAVVSLLCTCITPADEPKATPKAA